MRKLKITADFLRRAEIGACTASRNYFRRVYPDGLEVTDDQETNFRIAQDHNDRGFSVRGARTSDDDRAARDDMAWIATALYGHDRCLGVCCAPHTGQLAGGEFATAGELADAVGVYLERTKA